jgi:antitoxin component YwqK of YwqJK toxin-antitoxin module
MSDLQIAEIPYPSGSVYFRYSRYLSADESRWIRHGFFQAYHENGALASEGHYEHGREHGPWTDFYDNGQLAAEGVYNQGTQSGVWRYWSASGIPRALNGAPSDGEFA